MIVGHADARAAFEAALAADRVHHAWLLAGPVGVGKRAFADAAALALLGGGARLGEGGTATALVAAGNHPDLVVLEREALKAGGRAAQILLHQVRGDAGDAVRRSHVIDERAYVARLFRSTSAMGGRRVVIVDAADELNESAANALLKMLEEPPAATVFLMVSHAPGRLLPTIRSRARRLRFGRLGQADVRAVLAAAGVDEDLEAMVALADGAPGRALRWAGVGVDGLARELDALAGAAPGEARARGLALGRALSGKAAAGRYEAWLDLAPRRLAARARVARGGALGAVLARWEAARALAESAVPLGLEPGAVATELARLVAGVDRD